MLREISAIVFDLDGTLIDSVPDLHAAGKVRHFGVSNHTPGQIELLKIGRAHV